LDDRTLRFLTPKEAQGTGYRQRHDLVISIKSLKRQVRVEGRVGR
jgi:hypothetical protein